MNAKAIEKENPQGKEFRKFVFSIGIHIIIIIIIIIIYLFIWGEAFINITLIICAV
jgi:hypothetical protein